MRLTEQLAVRDLVALGRVLLRPDDDLSRACVLKGPLVGLDEAQLFTLAYDRGRKSLWQRLGEQAKGDVAFGAAPVFLEDLAARADYVAPFELYAALPAAGRGREKLTARLCPDPAHPLDELLPLALAHSADLHVRKELVITMHTPCHP